MSTPLIAVAVTDEGILAPHAGRALIWRVYTVENALAPRLEWTLTLQESGSLHEWHVRDNANRHPLHSCDVAIAASAGEGVQRRLAEQGTRLVTGSEKNPVKAITDYLSGSLAPGLPHERDCPHSDQPS